MTKYLGFLIIALSISFGKTSAQSDNKNRTIDLKVAIMGAPSFPSVEWNDLNIRELKSKGFNAVQLNIAWGYRPADDPLNLEDVLVLPKKFELPVDIDSTLNINVGLSKTFIRSLDKIALRAKELKHRIALCKKYGMRSIFHFGAPFVAYPPVEPLSQCISNPLTSERYVTLLQNFYKEFTGVDDILIYTYDQNAWLCSEVGPCPYCHGKPLDKRVADFINKLGQTWKQLNPKGTLWWEPWEISAGQVYKTIDLLDPSCISLSIHSSITEVQVAFPADRWFKNVLTKAAEKKINVLGELWLGGATEELEPYTNISAPLATLHALRAVYNAGKLKGLKEYYGIIPGKEDANLRMTSIFFKDPGISDKEAMTQLTNVYGVVSKEVSDYWKLTSEAIEFYPWDVSWLAREVGRSDPDHLLSAAVLKGASWQTPSWQSSRRSSLMRTDQTDEPNFWMREDIQLRCEQAALKMKQAIELAKLISSKVPVAYKDYFVKSIIELEGFKRTTLCYVFHLRETNLANNMRASLAAGQSILHDNIDEMKKLLNTDRANMINKAPIDAAINLFESDIKEFLKNYFIYTKPTNTKAGWNITSN
jgi:hypothetical protein